MKKRFLLIAGPDYYPNRADADWIEFFETREEAESYVEPEGPQRYKITLPSGHYTFADWYEIIDVQNWNRKERDTYHTWHEPKKTSDWYDCAHCEAGYPDQECTCEGFVKGEE